MRIIFFNKNSKYTFVSQNRAVEKTIIYLVDTPLLAYPTYAFLCSRGDTSKGIYIMQASKVTTNHFLCHLYTPYTFPGHSVYAPDTLGLCSLYTLYTLPVHPLHAPCTLSIRSLFTKYMLPVHSVYALRTP